MGIDPGASGGVAVIRDGILTAWPMPDSEHDLWDLFLPLIGADAFAVVEKVTGYVGNKGDPGSAMFTFGVSYGMLRMALVAACIPHELVVPRTWQKGLGIASRDKTETRTDWKNRLKANAARLFPSSPVTLKTADAILICEYCRRSRQHAFHNGGTTEGAGS